MHTPNLRRHTVRVGVLAVAALFVTFALVVYLVLNIALRDTLSDVLDTRLELAAEVVEQMSPEAAAEQLTSLGIPATLRTPAGELIVADPATVRSGGAPPVVGGLAEPLVSRSSVLDDGSIVEVYATRAGVDRTLLWLFGALTAGVGGGVMIAYVLFRRLAEDTLAPLSQVAATAEQISRGETATRLEPDDPETELGRMASSFDQMLDSLAAAMASEEQERERTHRFLADAAHQLRTPMTGIRASAELLLRETDPEVRDRLLASTVRETARASRIVSSLLHIARLDQGRPPARAPADLWQLVEAEAARAQDLSPRLRIEVHRSPDELGLVRIEVAEVTEALSNLLDNARRHAATRVDIDLAANDGGITVTIRDDGPGVAAGTEELIFARFATLDGRGGSGLGLPIARGVARAHGGELTYERGAFVLTLPGSSAS